MNCTCHADRERRTRELLSWFWTKYGHVMGIYLMEGELAYEDCTRGWDGHHYRRCNSNQPIKS